MNNLYQFSSQITIKGWKENKLKHNNRYQQATTAFGLSFDSLM